MYVIFALILCHIAWSDVTKRKIPNIDIVFLFVLGFLGIYWQGWFVQSAKLAFLSALFFLFFYGIFFAFKLVAAGDVKLAAAMAFCIGGAYFFQIWCIAVMVQLVYAILAWYFPMMLKENQEKKKHSMKVQRKRQIPYGLVLGLSTGIFFLKKALL